MILYDDANQIFTRSITSQDDGKLVKRERLQDLTSAALLQLFVADNDSSFTYKKRSHKYGHACPTNPAKPPKVEAPLAVYVFDDGETKWNWHDHASLMPLLQRQGQQRNGFVQSLTHAFYGRRRGDLHFKVSAIRVQWTRAGIIVNARENQNFLDDPYLPLSCKCGTFDTGAEKVSDHVPLYGALERRVREAGELLAGALENSIRAVKKRSLWTCEMIFNWHGSEGGLWLIAVQNVRTAPLSRDVLHKSVYTASEIKMKQLPRKPRRPRGQLGLSPRVVVDTEKCASDSILPNRCPASGTVCILFASPRFCTL